MKHNEFISLEKALQYSGKDIVKLHETYLNDGLVKLLSLVKFDLCIVKAEGVSLWDSQGKEYLDCLGGYGSLNVGHNNPEVLEAIQKVSQRPNLLQASLNPFAGVLAHNLARITPGNLQRSFFCNSGAEAVEGALKLARLASGKRKIVSTVNSFHGKSFGALSVTGREKYRTPFLPLVPDIVQIPFQNVGALEDELKGGDVAAVILEPIQGEGGIVVPEEGYLSAVRELCNSYNALMIVDEIQTGFGRTGRMFACEYEGVVPDILCLAKSLSGGMIPIGAYVCSEEVWRKSYGAKLENATLHTSTFGGNSLAAAAGITTLEIIERERLVENAEKQGAQLLNKLKEIAKGSKFICDVRGKGLLIGIEFAVPKRLGKKIETLAREYIGALVAGELFNTYGILTAYTLNNPAVLRLEPPLIITEKEVERIADALSEIVERYSGMGKLLFSAVKNLIRKR